MATTTETRFSALDDHHWHIARSMWMRGASWWITKTSSGRRWNVSIPGVSFKPFTTKTAAYNVVTEEILAESTRRMNLERNG